MSAPQTPCNSFSCQSLRSSPVLLIPFVALLVASVFVASPSFISAQDSQPAASEPATSEPAASKPESRPSAGSTPRSDLRATQLLKSMFRSMGGSREFWAKKDVQFLYTYWNATKDVKDVSIERYIFDGEKSWAKYTTHTAFVLPNSTEPVISYFDGESTTSTVGGEPVEDEQANSVLHFLRKTNFYWFTMFYKLEDPGVVAKYLGRRKANLIDYDVIEITYADGVGESSNDRYVLYLNPYTGLVDLFLFNVTAFNILDPLRMDVRYSLVDGVLVPSWRAYRPAASWDSHEVKDGGDVVYELTENIKFSSGFTAEDFALE